VRKLLLQLHVSVDGYFDGPNQELDWFVLDEEFFAYVEAMLGSIDGILLGRTTYEGFAAHWPNSTQAEASKMNTLPKFVASTTLSNATWSNTTIMADDVPNVVGSECCGSHETGARERILRLLEAQSLRPPWQLTASLTSTGSSSSPCSWVVASGSLTACPSDST